MKLVRTNVFYAVLVWLSVLVLLGSVLYMGYIRNVSNLRELMENEAERLADIVTVATAVGIDALEDIEYLTAYRLFDNARYLDRLYPGAFPEAAALDSITAEHELYGVEILDASGATVAMSSGADDDRKRIRDMYADEIAGVLDGTSWGEFLGFDTKRHMAGNIKGVVLGRRGGGAVIIQTSVDRLFEYRRSFGIGTLATLFNGMSADRGVNYIVLQDTLGIVVASPNVSRMTRIKSDPFLMDALRTGGGSRMLDVDDGRVLEVVGSLVTNERDFGLLRIGLTTDAIDDIKKSTFRHFAILFLVSLVSGTFVFLYLLQRQNFMLLNKEHDRILDEVKIMEEETRRAERLASMGNLAAGVAHEIRNPLNSISMIVQQLGDEIGSGKSDPDHTAMLATVGSEIGRIGSIIEHFLRYARPPELIISAVDMGSVITGVTDIVRVTAAKRNIALETDVKCRTMCVCDADQIKQSLVNIVNNAIEAVGENGVIRIACMSVNGHVGITVEDSGPGIDGDVIGKVFDPYFTTRDDGTGLGLSEVHRIITAHGGRVSAGNGASSGNGRSGGAVFTIELPCGDK